MFNDNLHSLLRDLKEPFFKEMIQQKAIKDSFYSWYVKVIATTDKKCAIFTQIVLIMVTRVISASVPLIICVSVLVSL